MNLLWLKSELLHPIDKGGKIRTYQTLRFLKERHRVTYLTLDDGQAAPDAAARAHEYCHDLVRVPFAPPARGTPGFFADLARNLASSLPYAVARYRSAAMTEAIARVIREQAIDLVVCDFLVPAVNLPHQPGVPTLLFQHNVEAAIWERHARVATNPVARRYFRVQWQRMRAFERDACRRFDHVVAVSEEDATVFREAYGVPSVTAVATGVDLDFFRPSGTVPPRPHHLAFTGSMDWMPNVDGIRWFVKEVLPLVRQAVPAVSLSIVGRKPAAAVQALADPAAGIVVTGTVPDIRPYLEEAAVVVVPLRVGGGTRLKIYEAMAMERPIVATTVGAEGLPVQDGATIRIADDPPAFAAAIVALLHDAAQAGHMGRAGADLVRARFGWAQVNEQFDEACRQAVATGRRAGRPGRAA